MKDKSLGRGLSSLIPQHQQKDETSDASKDQGRQASEQPASAGQEGAGEFQYVEVTTIEPNPYQPRKTFEESALADLASSIAEKGVLQPLVLQKNTEGTGFVLIAGERRWRAAKQAGLHHVPALIQEALADADQARLALIENLQREDLDPIERARGVADLQERFQFTQQQIAEHLHLSRSRVANTLRLLSLPSSAQTALAEGKITEGHAKIIAGLPDVEAQERLLHIILKQTLNVRDTESLVKTAPESYQRPVNERVKHIAGELSERLESKVEVRARKDRYVVTLNMSSEEDLQELAERLNS
jgi:ParB family chromosome partitioning protein